MLLLMNAAKRSEGVPGQRPGACSSCQAEASSRSVQHTPTYSLCVVVFVLVAAQGLSLEERTAVGGETAITLAIKAGLLQNVKSLLVHGASPHNTNSKNESPLLLGK